MSEIRIPSVVLSKISYANDFYTQEFPIRLVFPRKHFIEKVIVLITFFETPPTIPSIPMNCYN